MMGIICRPLVLASLALVELTLLQLRTCPLCNAYGYFTHPRYKTLNFIDISWSRAQPLPSSLPPMNTLICHHLVLYRVQSRLAKNSQLQCYKIFPSCDMTDCAAPPNQSRLHISMEAQGSNVSRWWQLKLCVYVTGLCYCNLQFYLAKETSFLFCFSMFTQLYTAKRQKKALTSWQITLCSTSQTWQNHCGAPALPQKFLSCYFFFFFLGCGDFCQVHCW